MTYNKEIIVSFAGLLAIAALSSARPNQNEQLVSRSASPFSQVASSKVPSSEGNGRKKDEIPIQLYYDVPATVQEVDEDEFRQGKLIDDSTGDLESGVKRRIQRYEKLSNAFDKEAVWSSVTNIIEYVSNDEPRVKRATKRDEEASKIFPILKKLKRDNLHVLRIKVRRGGVAIAGPGGIASAGMGGTAIVGPGGSAFTEADGTAVVGPGAKLYQIPSDSRGRARSGFQGYKLIATGPYVFQPTPRQTESPKYFF